jgi:cytochrome c-type biogenesis protein
VSAGGILLAFAAGLISFASPCVLPLVPGYLAAIGGLDPQSPDAPRDVRRAILASLPFIAGFSAVFVSVGAVAGALASLLRTHAPETRQLAGIIVVAMGFALLGLLPFKPLRMTTAPGAQTARRHGSAALLGAAFAVAWTPCHGPVLAGILALAATDGGAPRAALLLLVYSAGLAVPFLAVAAGYRRALGASRWVRDRYQAVQLASGALLVGLGLLLFFDHLSDLNQLASQALQAVGAGGLPTL